MASYSELPHAMHHWSSHALCLLIGKCIEIIVQAIDPLEKSCGWISRSSLQVYVSRQKVYIGKGLGAERIVICAVFTLKDLKQKYKKYRNTRIGHTDLFNSYKPLIFSAGPYFHLRSESTVLGRKLKNKCTRECSTFGLHNFLLFSLGSK